MRDITNRGLVAIALAMSGLFGACTYLPSSGTTTEVTIDDPGRERTIECRGASPITGDDCVLWAERVMDQLPTETAGAARIVLTDGQGVGRCNADFQDGQGAIYASAPVPCL